MRLPCVNKESPRCKIKFTESCSVNHVPLGACAAPCIPPVGSTESPGDEGEPTWPVPLLVADKFWKELGKEIKDGELQVGRILLRQNVLIVLREEAGVARREC